MGVNLVLLLFKVKDKHKTNILQLVLSKLRKIATIITQQNSTRFCTNLPKLGKNLRKYCS